MKRISLILLVLVVVAPVFANDLKGSRPNIIFVMPDNQGMGDLSCLGNEVLRTRLCRPSFRANTEPR